MLHSWIVFPQNDHINQVEKNWLTLTIVCIFLAGGSAPTGFSCCQVLLRRQAKQTTRAANDRGRDAAGVLLLHATYKSCCNVGHWPGRFMLGCAQAMQSRQGGNVCKYSTARALPVNIIRPCVLQRLSLLTAPAKQQQLTLMQLQQC